MSDPGKMIFYYVMADGTIVELFCFWRHYGGWYMIIQLARHLMRCSSSTTYLGWVLDIIADPEIRKYYARNDEYDGDININVYYDPFNKFDRTGRVDDECSTDEKSEDRKVSSILSVPRMDDWDPILITYCIAYNYKALPMSRRFFYKFAVEISGMRYSSRDFQYPLDVMTFNKTNFVPRRTNVSRKRKLNEETVRYYLGGVVTELTGPKTKIAKTMATIARCVKNCDKITDIKMAIMMCKNFDLKYSLDRKTPCKRVKSRTRYLKKSDYALIDNATNPHYTKMIAMLDSLISTNSELGYVVFRKDLLIDGYVEIPNNITNKTSICSNTFIPVNVVGVFKKSRVTVSDLKKKSEEKGSGDWLVNHVYTEFPRYQGVHRDNWYTCRHAGNIEWDIALNGENTTSPTAQFLCSDKREIITCSNEGDTNLICVNHEWVSIEESASVLKTLFI